mgnify:CR=1 FL=1
MKYDINLGIVDDIEQSLKELSGSYEITIYYDEEVGTEEKSFEKTIARLEKLKLEIEILKKQKNEPSSFLKN